MKYTIRLIFIEKPTINGWCNVIAEVEMHKITLDCLNNKYDKINELIEELKKSVKKKYDKEAYQILNKLHKGTNKQIFRLKKKITKFVPYFYGIDDNKPIYEDKYGDLLLITDLQTLQDAIIADKENGKEYRRFDIVLAIIDQLMNKDNWYEDIKVILWRH